MDHDRAPLHLEDPRKVPPPSMKSPISPRPFSKRKLEDDRSENHEKRRKESQATYEMVDGHWATDGNVLLQLGKSRFKLHKSRLIDRSLWFKCLFERSSGSRIDNDIGQEHLENVEHVLRSHLSEDGLDLFFLDGLPHGPKPSFNGFSELLTAMDNAMYVYFRYDHQVPLIYVHLTASTCTTRQITKCWSASLSLRQSSSLRSILPSPVEESSLCFPT